MRLTKINKTAAILAGGMMFAGSAGAATIFTEDFESGTGQWQTAWGTYGTAINYSGDPHSSVASGGSTYGNLIFNQGATVNEADVVSNTIVINGGDLASVDAGTATWDASVWAASYTAEPGERAVISLEYFSDAAGTISLGAKTAILTDTGSTAGDADWTEFTNSGTVATGARSFQITYGSTSGNDSYADNVSYTITPVPEPSSTALLGLGGLALILRRRK